jgi:serine/threonine protein kinase
VSETWTVDPLIGTQLGSCVIERLLAAGGMGAVYLARQLSPRRLVAIKVLQPRHGAAADAQRQFLARFRREADATAALDHANIMPIYAFGEERGVAYLVMPYLPDGSVADLLARHDQLPLDLALRFLEQTAAALDYAHRHGIVHRDVKPSNLLLHPDGRVLLADFGIARALDLQGSMHPPESYTEAKRLGPAETASVDATLTRADAVMGTPAYMAPEQVHGEAAGPAADIYALGAVAYALLTGRPPFIGPDSASLLQRQLTEAPPQLRDLRPELPPSLEQVIAWALANAPAQRPPSASAFTRALREASSTADGQHPRTAQPAPGTGVGYPARASAATGWSNGWSSMAVDAQAPTVYDIDALEASAGAPAGYIWPAPAARVGGTMGTANPRRRVTLLALAAGTVAIALIGLIGGLQFVGFIAGTIAPMLVGGEGGIRDTQLPISPTTTPSPSPDSALAFNPEHLVLTPAHQDGHVCSGTQTITNTTAQTIGWTWQKPSIGGMHFQVNDSPQMDWPQDTTPGIAPGGTDTLTVTADCKHQAQSFYVVVKNTLGGEYTLVLNVQGSGD